MEKDDESIKDNMEKLRLKRFESYQEKELKDRLIQIQKSEPGLKFDLDKIKLDLLSPIAMEDLGKVLTHGAKKYGPNNWRKGILFSRLIAAAKRHLLKFEQGKDIDSESGLNHLAHSMCNLMMLLEMTKKRVRLGR